MELSLENNLFISYACHITSHNDLNLIKNNLEIVSKKCKIIGITYSIKSNILDKDIIKDILTSFQKDIINMEVYGEIKNEGYDFKKHVHTIKKFQEKTLNNDYILMMNDSVIPTSDISFNNAMSKLLISMNEGYEFIGFLASKELMRHYQSWFWCCDKNVIEWLLYQIDNIICPENKDDIVLKLEVGLSNILIRNKKSKALYDFDVQRNLFYYHPDVYINALDNGFPF